MTRIVIDHALYPSEIAAALSYHDEASVGLFARELFEALRDCDEDLAAAFAGEIADLAGMADA
jgi:hypothetical protein